MTLVINCISKIKHIRGKMDITIEDNGVTIIRLDGRFDSAMSEHFKKSVKSLCDKGQVNYVINLKNVTYIDSSGLGALVSSLRQIRQMTGELKVSCLNEQVRSIFQLIRCHRLIEIYDDPQTAVSSFDNTR